MTPPQINLFRKPLRVRRRNGGSKPPPYGFLHTISVGAVGAAISRPPDRCEARIGISEGNTLQTINSGDVVLFQNHYSV